MVGRAAAAHTALRPIRARLGAPQIAAMNLRRGAVASSVLRHEPGTARFQLGVSSRSSVPTLPT